jgi:hypothetical protein
MAGDLDLRAIVANAAPEDLPALVGKLAEAQAVAMARIATPRPPAATAPPTRLLTPEEAAGIPNVPVKRIYEWARGKNWASRPTRRCLRIEEAGFRRWLAARIH